MKSQKIVSNFLEKLVKAVTIVILLSGVSIVHADTTMQEIKSGKQLKVCAWAPYLGITSKDAEGHWHGVDIEMGRLLAESLGVDVVFKSSSFGKFTKQLKEKDCHIAMFGIGRTFARAQNVTFSSPYMASGLHAVVNAKLNPATSWKELDVAGKNIAVTKNTFVEVFMSTYLKNATMLPITPPEWTKALESGKADALVTDFVFANKLKRTTDWAVVVSPETELSLTTYGYAVAPESQYFLKFVDFFISESQRNGTLKRIAKKHQLDAILYPK